MIFWPTRHPPTSQSSILYTIAKRHNLHSSDWFIFAHLPHPCPRLRACNRDVLCEAGHSIDRDTLAERSKAVAQGAIPKGRGFEPHRCHFSESCKWISTGCCATAWRSVENIPPGKDAHSAPSSRRAELSYILPACHFVCGPSLIQRSPTNVSDRENPDWCGDKAFG